jgi:hypothetical protein
MFKDWPKRITDNKGSAMVMVIVAIVFLSVLGLAILSLSVASLKVSLFDKKATLSFYMAESGLEQAYDVILTNVKGAIEAGNIAVAREVEEYVAGGGTEDVAAIMADPDHEKYQEWLVVFQEEYRDYLKFFLLDDLKEEDNYFDVGESSAKPEISVDEGNSSIFTDDTTCYVTLKSAYNAEEYQGKTIPQEVQMKFNLQVPTSLPGTVEVISGESGDSGTPSIPDTPSVAESDSLFDCVLVSSNYNIVANRPGQTLDDGGIKRSQYIINGNVYAKNNFTAYKKDLDITVNGNLVAANNLQHNKESSVETKNSNIEVTGNVYAKNIAINAGCLDNTITVKKDAYTSGNLTLNGTREININGNWFYTEGVSGEVIDPSIATLPGVKIYTADDSACTSEQLDRLAFKLQQYNDMHTIMNDIYFQPTGSYPAGGMWEYTYFNVHGTFSGSIEIDPLDGQGNFTSILDATVEVQKYFDGIEDPDPTTQVPTYIGIDSTKLWETHRTNYIDEVYWVDNTGKDLYIIAPGSTFSPQSSVSGFEGSKRAVYVKDNFKGIIVNKGQVFFYGVKEFNGLVLTPHCIMLENNSYDWDKTVTDPIPMVLNADKEYVKNKIEEIKNLGKNHFKYEDPQPDPSGDGGGGEEEPETGTSVTGSTVTGNPFSEDFFKTLIEVSDWAKLS